MLLLRQPLCPTRKILCAFGKQRQQQRHGCYKGRRPRQQQPIHCLRCCCSIAGPGISELLQNRSWMLPKPDAQIHRISLMRTTSRENDDEYDYRVISSGISTVASPSPRHPFSFYIIRDDLLHPLVNGNKARKLDAVIPVLQLHSVTDVVTCGGCQSAHAAATAVSCSERSIRSHLLLRGEQPEIPTGYNLVSLMFADDVVYVPRSVYANREEMLREHASRLHAPIHLLDDILKDGNSSIQQTTQQCASKVVILNEGAGSTAALLGVIRLVQYLSQSHLFRTDEPINIVLDAGTGTTAIGLGIGVKSFGLPWKIIAVMLADTREGYKEFEKQLISDFKEIHGEFVGDDLDGHDNGVVQWVERVHERKFGKVLQGEIGICQKIAQQTGILVDPIYTLAAWEHAVRLCHADFGSSKVFVLHTGGTLGIFGLAQRYNTYFHAKT